MGIDFVYKTIACVLLIFLQETILNLSVGLFNSLDGLRSQKEVVLFCLKSVSINYLSD